MTDHAYQAAGHREVGDAQTSRRTRSNTLQVAAFASADWWLNQAAVGSPVVERVKPPTAEYHPGPVPGFDSSHSEAVKSCPNPFRRKSRKMFGRNDDRQFLEICLK
jgi:hypothetical protein